MLGVDAHFKVWCKYYPVLGLSKYWHHHQCYQYQLNNTYTVNKHLQHHHHTMLLMAGGSLRHRSLGPTVGACIIHAVCLEWHELWCKYERGATEGLHKATLWIWGVWVLPRKVPRPCYTARDSAVLALVTEGLGTGSVVKCHNGSLSVFPSVTKLLNYHFQVSTTSIQCYLYLPSATQ